MKKTKEELETLKKEYETLTNKLKELNEEELFEVTGGEGSGTKTIVVPVKLPTCISGNCFITIYVDGVLQSNMSTVVDASFVEVVNLLFKGNRGIKLARVKLNDEPYKSYCLDFNNQTYRED